MSKYYGDLHVHIGYNEDGLPVKITGSKDLNFANIAHESLFRKGIDIVGVVDCASPRVLKDIKKGISEGVFTEVEGGGLLYKDRLLIILGSEIELSAGDGAFHVIAYLPTVESMEKLSKELSKYIKNINLSTQKAHMDFKDLVKITDNLGGIIVPAHVFTPHKGIYGNCTDSLKSLLGKELFNKIPAIELGLSGNTYLASFIRELDSKGFLSNSDAHSIGKIGREYNLFDLENLDFQSYVKSLSNKENNSIIANYGLNPKLGKYHRTYCCDCDKKIEGEPPAKCCNESSKHNIVMGVFDRIWDIKTR